MAHVATRKYPPVKARRGVGTTVFAILALSQYMTIQSSETRAAEASFADFPFLVHCQLNGVERAYYLSRIDADGVAVYATPESQAGTITILGKAKPIGGDWSGSCAGKTLEQLRSAGQAFYLQPSQ